MLLGCFTIFSGVVPGIAAAGEDAVDLEESEQRPIDKESTGKSIERAAQSSSTEKRFDISSLRMPIQVEQSVLEALGENERERVGSRICQSLASALVVGQGPWGFGYVAEPPECRVVEKAKVEKGADVWTLMVARKSAKAIVVKICREIRSSTGGTENCLAKRDLPAGKRIAKVLSHPYFARGVVAALNDQMPFQSKLVPELIQKKPDGQSYFMPKEEPPLAPKIGIPPYSIRLLAIAAKVLPESGLFSVSPVKRSKAIEEAGKGGLWLAGAKGRGRRTSEFDKALAAIYKEVLKSVKFTEERQANPASIVGRDQRYEVKLDLSFMRRLEGEASVRGGYFNGAGAVQPESSYGGSADVALYANPWLNLWLDASYTNSTYKAETSVDSGGDDASSDSVTANFKNVRFGVGFGVRYSFSYDLTFYLYPRVSRMHLSWIFSDSEKLGVVGFRSEVDDTFFPLYGVGAGFRSPEAWPINAQITLGYDGIAAPTYRGMYADLEFMYDLPHRVADVTSFGLFDRAWLSLYLRAQNHKFNVANKYQSEGVLDIYEVIGGLGYRLEFL
jgi:hypothetical protein